MGAPAPPLPSSATWMEEEAAVFTRESITTEDPAALGATPTQTTVAVGGVRSLSCTTCLIYSDAPMCALVKVITLSTPVKVH